MEPLKLLLLFWAGCMAWIAIIWALPRPVLWGAGLIFLLMLSWMLLRGVTPKEYSRGVNVVNLKM